MKSIRLPKRLGSFMVVMMFFSTPAFADEGVMAMVRDMQARMQEMQKTINWQSQKIRDLETGVEERTTLPEPAGNFQENLKAAIHPAETWLEGVDFFGDFRLRYEAREESREGDQDRNRFRYRLRFGFEKAFNEEWAVGFRLVSAGTSSRDSTNTTFDSAFSYKPISIDMAYATYTPGFADGLEITAGKFKNPFLGGSTKAIWDGDVTPEGIYERYEFNALESEGLDLKGTVTAGQFIVQEGSGSGDVDSELYAVQAILGSKIKAGDSNLKTEHAVSYYHWKDFAQNTNFAAANGNPTISGGTLLAAREMRVLEIYNEIGIPVPGLKSGGKLYFDWLRNLANDARVRANGDDESNAWILGGQLGKAKKKGGWEVGYEYRYLEANSVPGVFTDSDFGGVNQRGSVFKAAYALTDFLTLKGAVFLVDTILEAGDPERDMYQIDLVWAW